MTVKASPAPPHITREEMAHGLAEPLLSHQPTAEADEQSVGGADQRHTVVDLHEPK